MNLDDELEELNWNPNDSYVRRRSAIIRSEIEKREVDYDYFLRTEGEAIAQLDGMQLVRWAFRRGWEAAREGSND